MALKTNVRERCPICGKWDDVGYQGMKKYFCNECFVEFHYKKGYIEIYNITSNGVLSFLKKIKITG